MSRPLGGPTPTATGRAAGLDQPNGRGRRPLRDGLALKLMGLLLEAAADRGEPLSGRAAARQACALLGVAGASPSAVADRLRKKQRAQRAAAGSFASQSSVVERNKSHAPKMKSVHQEAEEDAMDTVSAIETCEAPPTTPSATAGVVIDPSMGPGQLISVRVITASAMTELLLPPDVARALHSDLTAALDRHDHRVTTASIGGPVQ